MQNLRGVWSGIWHDVQKLDERCQHPRHVNTLGCCNRTRRVFQGGDVSVMVAVIMKRRRSFFLKYCKCLFGLLFLVKHSSYERWCEAVTFSSWGRSSLLPGLGVAVCVVVRSFCRVKSCSCCRRDHLRVGLTLVRFTRISCLENPTIFKLVYEEYKTFHRNSYPCLR